MKNSFDIIRISKEEAKEKGSEGLFKEIMAVISTNLEGERSMRPRGPQIG